MGTTFTIFVAAIFLGTCVLETQQVVQNSTSINVCLYTDWLTQSLLRISKCWHMYTALLFFYCVCLSSIFMLSCYSILQVGREQYKTNDLFCPRNEPGEKQSSNIYFNDMATLMFQSQESGIKHLFHRNGEAYTQLLQPRTHRRLIISLQTYTQREPQSINKLASHVAGRCKTINHSVEQYMLLKV